jgi:hypothetical protein
VLLFLGLDTFRHDVQPVTAGKIEDGPDDGSVLRIDTDIPYESEIDLQPVGPNPFQQAQRSVARPTLQIILLSNPLDHAAVV